MRILLINQYFHPDMAATSQLLGDLAEDLTLQGWEVTALAGRGSYAASSNQALPRRENWSGIDIRRLWCTDFGRKSSIGRMSDYLSYLCSALLFVLFAKHQDVVLCLSTPPLVAILGIVAKLRGSLFVYKVEDLYPDIAIALQTLRPGFVTKALSFISRLLLSKADMVVSLDDRMAHTVKTRGAHQIKTIPNWADGQAIYPDDLAGKLFCQKHGLANKFIVLYSGNLGLAHRFDAISQAAKTLAKKDSRIHFLFVGGGTRLAEVQEAAKGLLNVQFMAYIPRIALNELYNAADIHLVSLRDETAGLQVPSKYSAALAAGKPVMLVGGNGSDLSSEITAEHVGWVCDHCSSQIEATILAAARDGDQSKNIGRTARELFMKRYDRNICTAKWIELLDSISVSEKLKISKAEDYGAQTAE